MPRTPITYHVGSVLDELADEITTISENKGFWDFEEDSLLVIPAKLALVDTETSEALEVHRKLYDDAKPDPISGMTPMQEDDFAEELADGIIRLLDIAGFYELNIGDALVGKVEKNRHRIPRHGKRY
jgi:NTP pyrophosphatase (non-canonical NTP hydrolase)